MTIGLICGLLGVLALVSLPFVLGAVFRSVSRKLDRLLEETKRDGAIIHTKCMLREGAIECPGVVQVVDDQLLVTGLVKSKRFLIPLSEVSLRKEARWWSGGRRFGRHAFHLDSPKTQRLIIAVNDPRQWRNIFNE
ncbi:hypothetical protein ACFL9U_08820 [Thermodesulfobacteriota bacterium]